MTPATLAEAGALLYGPLWQSEMARALGIGQEQVNRWARGHRPIPDHRAEAIRELLRERAAAITAHLHAPAP